MGLDRNAFSYLHGFFKAELASRRSDKRGRPRLIDSSGSLALALHHLNSTMTETVLCQLFGLVPGTVSTRLNEALSVLDVVLPKLPECFIGLPDGRAMHRMAAELNSSFPLVHNVFGFIDGVSFVIYNPSLPKLQNAYYNGWKGECTVTNVLGFCVDGTLFWARTNCPGLNLECFFSLLISQSCLGSWHDSRVAMPLYRLLLEDVPRPLSIVADSAFPHREDMEGIILTPLRKDEQERLESAVKHGRLSRQDYERKMATSAQITSCRQAAEWSMRSLQGTFSRLKATLTTDQVKRARLIRICLYLFNLRVRRVGLMQVRTVYERYWKDGVIDDPDFDRVDAWYSQAAPPSASSAPPISNASVAIEEPDAAAPAEPAESKRSTHRRMQLVDLD